MHLLLMVTFLVGDFGPTSSLIHVPCAPRLKQGTFALAVMPSFASRGDTRHHAELDVILKYGFAGKGEAAIAAYSANSYAASFSYLLKPESKSSIGWFGGVDDLTYTKEVSSTGGTGSGFPDDSMYAVHGGRNPEVFSLYFAGYKRPKPFTFIFGLGRGRFVGYGPRSRYFNMDYYFRGVGGDTRKPPNVFMPGLFMGASVDLGTAFSFMLEFDGRDANAGFRYRHKYVDVNFAVTKIEQTGMADMYSSRYAFGVEGNTSFLTEVPKTGVIAASVIDAQNRTRSQMS